jgi:hypothetical protein
VELKADGRPVSWPRLRGSSRSTPTDATSHPLLLFDPSEFDLPQAWVDGYCRVCSLPPTALGHDPCIQNLGGGIVHACCGHGIGTAYLVTEAGDAIYGSDAIERMRKLGGAPP